MYTGFRLETGAMVAYTSPHSGEVEQLDPRLDLWNHSPSGLEWGYLGSGPSQLALALLAHATGDDSLAIRLHQRFKREVVGRFHNDFWSLHPVCILRWACQAAEDLLADVQDVPESEGVRNGRAP